MSTAMSGLSAGSAAVERSSSSSSSPNRMHYVGLDVHARQTTLEMLNDRGQTVKRQTIRGGLDKVVEEVAKLPRPLSIAYEASCGYGYLHERLWPLAKRVVVGHPAQMRLIFRSKRKNDQFDCGKIAKLLYLDVMPQVHVPGVEVRQWRGLIEFRVTMLNRRVALKNQVRALLRGLGITAPRGLWSKKGIAWLKELSGLGDADALRRDMLIDELSEVNRRMKPLEQMLAKIADRHPAVRLLMTIPGVGIRTAEAVVAYVDDINRFGKMTQLGTYFGLVPCQDSSAAVNRLGHITKEGPATVRKLLCEAAWQARRRSPRVNGWFERIAGGDADRRKIAAVAVARQLVVVMGHMLRSGEAWREGASTSMTARTGCARRLSGSPPEDTVTGNGRRSSVAGAIEHPTVNGEP
jgi:transposase